MADFAAYLGDSDSRNTVREAHQKATIRRGTVRHAVRACRSEASADVLLVDLDGEQNPLVHMVELLRVCRPETVIVTTGSENSVTLANELYRGGVFLYLPKPLEAGDLRRAVAEVDNARDEDARPEIQTSRLVLVLGKGMGANTVTTLLARLAADRGRYVTCADLDADFGTLSLALDTAPERGFAQALADGGGSVERLPARVSPRIGLVAHPMDQAGHPVDQSGLLRLVNALSAQAHMVLACGPDVSQVQALRHVASNHVVVFEPTPAGVSVAARWLHILGGAPSTLVANHARPLPRLLDDSQLKSHLGGRSPDVVLPYIKGMATAMALGEPDRALAKRERALMDRLLNPLIGLTSAAEAAWARVCACGVPAPRPLQRRSPRRART